LGGLCIGKKISEQLAKINREVTDYASAGWAFGEATSSYSSSFGAYRSSGSARSGNRSREVRVHLSHVNLDDAAHCLEFDKGGFVNNKIKEMSSDIVRVIRDLNDGLSFTESPRFFSSANNARP